MEDTNLFRESGEQQENPQNNAEQPARSGNNDENQERPRRRFSDRNDRSYRPAYRQEGDRSYQPRPRYNNGEGGEYRRPRYNNEEGGEFHRQDRPYQPRPRYNNGEGGEYRRPRYNNEEGGEFHRQDRPYQPRPRFNNGEGGEYRRPRYSNNEEGGEYRRPHMSDDEGNTYRRQDRPYQPRPRYNNGEGGEYRRPRYNRPAWQASEKPESIPDGNAYQPSDAEAAFSGEANAAAAGEQRQKRRRITRPAQEGEYRPVTRRQQYHDGEQAEGERPRYQEGGAGDRPRFQKQRRQNVQRPKPHRTEIPDYPEVTYTEPLRLNKFIANTGICSRREADEYIRDGRIMVNGELVTELGVKVNPTDTVTFDGKDLMPERKVYLLLNKPKGFVTSLEDEKDRKTVMDLVRCACRERIYPVGRLDRQTTGVLLFTNDGDLALKLTHPANHMRKIYQVQLDRSIPEEDLKRLSEGIELEDGFIAPDAVAYANDDDPSQVGVEIHSGRNRVVRRMFEAIGYTVKKLDRVYFAGLSKKGLKRGKWRFLSTQEVAFLKMMPSN